MGRATRVLFGLLVLAAAPVSAAVVGGEGRIALVIGNSAYGTSPLANPVRDARLMAAALEAQGFRMMARFDVGQTEMKLAITEFGRALEGAGAGARAGAGAKAAAGPRRPEHGA